MSSITLHEMMLIHIRAEGPVTFPSICKWMSEQWTDSLDDYQIAEELTALIKSGQVKLYDTGDAFDVA